MTEACFQKVTEFVGESLRCRRCESRQECEGYVVAKIAEVRMTLPENVQALIRKTNEFKFQTNKKVIGSKIGKKVQELLDSKLELVSQSLIEMVNKVEPNSPLGKVVELLVQEGSATNEQIRNAVGCPDAAAIICNWLNKNKLTQLNGEIQEII